MTADAAVSGTTVARRGYQLSKGLIESETSKCQRLSLDEIGRASRGLNDVLSLGRLIENAGKRMIGASDGFDSAQTHSRQMLVVFAMLHEWFVDQLRKKVHRGMRTRSTSRSINCRSKTASARSKSPIMPTVKSRQFAVPNCG